MNILYYSPIPFYPVRHGNISTINQYVKRLKKLGHNVHFVLLNEADIDDCVKTEMQKDVNTLDVIPFRNSRFVQDSNGYDVFDSRYQDGLGEEINLLCKKYKIEAIICTYIWQSKILDYVPSNVRKIIDTHDKMTDRHLALAKNNIVQEMFSCTQEDEKKYLNRADIIWARRDEETHYFNKITNSTKAITVTHFEDAMFLKKTYNKLTKIGILASDNQVNFKMVCDFAVEFNKRLRKQKLDIICQVTGNVKNMIFARKKPFRRFSNCYYKMIGRNDKIKGLYEYLFSSKYYDFTGPISNIEDFYNDVDLVIIPITFGTGINVKMVQAMAFGVPVISTECGIKGMLSDVELHHCKDITELVNGIYEIYRNPTKLNFLAHASEQCYDRFLSNATINFDKTFEEKI